MGWLSFLSRKSTNNLNNDNDLKAQAYHETVAAIPPIRGTYPVIGNGPSILERFQKSHPHLASDGYFNDSFNDNSAPPPIVPRVLDRPNTAPTQSPGGSSRPRSRGTSLKPLREPPKKRHRPYKLPPKVSTERNEESTATRSIHSVPSPSFPRDRNSSVFSADSESTRRFVDLLEAQSFIKPLDFFGRVKATGTKDYDEDVADRNTSENGSNLNSPQAGEFFRKNSAPSIRGGEGERERPRSSRKRKSTGYGSKTKSNTASVRAASPATLSLRAYEDDPASETALTEKPPRRSSLHSYATSASIERPGSASTGRRVKGQGSDYFPESLRELARAAIWEDFEYDQSVDLDLRGNRAHSTLSRKISMQRQESDSDLSYNANPSFNPPRSVKTDQPRSLSDSPQRRTISHTSSTINKPPSKTASLRTLHLPYRGELVTESYSPSSPSVEDPYRKNSHNSPKRCRGPIADFNNSPSELTFPAVINPKTIIGQASDQDGLNRRFGNGSIVSRSLKSLKQSEIEDIIPERGSSIRRSSLNSETAGSTLSSNPFRPQSGHTTNTSVDLAPRVSLPEAAGPDESACSPGENCVALDNDTEVDAPEPSYCDIGPEMLVGSLLNFSRQEPSTNFVVDEDASSVDSFDAPKRSAGEFEKDLLFQGYGLEGAQLPGLPASPDVTAKSNKLKRSQPSQTFLAPKDPFHLNSFSSTKFEDALSSTFSSQYSASSSKHKPLARSSRLQVPKFDYTDSERGHDSEPENESEDELNFDIPFKRPSEHRYSSCDDIRHYGTTARLFEDDDDDDLPDTAVVARLLREAKSKQRASSASLRKSMGKGKAPDFRIPRIELDDHSDIGF
ncbi:uncharacterized protein F4812DRAFT_418294 [Daldinia caldariorum]|uniref:uncharacterized protein n=1 Tax=Daldinia caldariorum TaxID=326644 RepID=UPI0020087B6B|nr:uncharacterized protein F4812DRAFT_418294 [Daldinia caldariorum]KAI1470587.1 hypothetical protein F4812DRAFT_418294 [Daldinia caldariorum]